MRLTEQSKNFPSRNNRQDVEFPQTAAIANWMGFTPLEILMNVWPGGAVNHTCAGADNHEADVGLLVNVIVLVALAEVDDEVDGGNTDNSQECKYYSGRGKSCRCCRTRCDRKGK